jgi:siroheme synthase-like protein
MRFLPLFFDTSSGVFILVGSGEAALAKLRLLRAAGAYVRWFSCSIDVAEELSTSLGKGQLEISVGNPLKADLSDVVAIVSAAGDLLDHHIAARARRQRIPVNVVDRPDLSTFIFPAIVDRGEVVVAIGTGGASPVLAQRLRERDRSVASHADRRACRIDRPPSRSLRRRSACAVAAPLLAECHRGSYCRGGGTRPDSHATVGCPDGLAALADAAGEGPAILVVGDVVARSAPWRAAEVATLIAREAA